VSKVIIRESALNDLDRISAYIGEDSPSASVRFLEEAQRAFQLISEIPGIGSPRDFDVPSLHGIRMCPIPRFRKYLIFYLPSQTSIEIVRVIHGSQDLAAIFMPDDE
jgi:toxin ParE1/3/4